MLRWRSQTQTTRAAAAAAMRCVTLFQEHKYLCSSPTLHQFAWLQIDCPSSGAA